MKRSKFSLSNYKVCTLNGGYLVPIGIYDVLPGDTIQMSTSALVRAQPLQTPVMHPVHVRIHHWFVPLRLIWDDFQNFITGGPDGNNASVFPTRALSYTDPTTGENLVGQLPDYLGVPPGYALTGADAVSALPFRAYNLVFNEWYRDQDLVSPLPISKASGVDTTTGVSLARIAWEKDYFTSARPFEQKGPAVTLPLGQSAPVVYSQSTPAGNSFLVRDSATGALITGGEAIGPESGTGVLHGATTGTDMFLDPNGRLSADLSQASAANVNDLREAFAIQRFEEARARYGSRYTEYLRYLNVRSSDARLQRPEYLGGGKQTIQFSEVLQTAEGEDTPVGELRGHGINATRSNRFRRFIEEHGFVISMMSIRPRTMYVQGLNRLWNRRTKVDFWQKELQHIGQQPVLNKEIYVDASDPDAVFGYQDRYDEYRRIENTVAGEMRTTVADMWHMARIFSGEPALNGSFVTCDPTTRVFAAGETQDQYVVMAYHSIQARRLVARTGSSFIY